MLALDTNVLVRYLAQDDRSQSLRATHLIEQELSGDAPGFVNLIVVCEVLWVLAGAYAMDETALVSVIERMLAARELKIEQSQLLRRALAIRTASGPGLADILIGLVNEAQGSTETVSFDKRAARLPGWRLLS